LNKRDLSLKFLKFFVLFMVLASIVLIMLFFTTTDTDFTLNNLVGLIDGIYRITVIPYGNYIQVAISIILAIMILVWGPSALDNN